MAGSNNKPVICIVSPNENSDEGTFIQAHIERLPAIVEHIYGGFFPIYKEKYVPIMGRQGIFSQVVRKIKRRLFHLSQNHDRNAVLRRYLKNNEVKAVLAEYGPTGTEVFEVCRNTGIPLIVHFHGYDAYQRKLMNEYSDRYKQMFEYTAAIIAVSCDMEAKLLSLGAPREKLHYNPCGVDHLYFKKANPEKSPTRFLAVGRFADVKAPHLTLVAFSIALKKVPCAKLIMIGDGPLLDSCKNLAAALEIDKAVEFKGATSHEVIAQEMLKSRAFVQHSLRASNGDSEGTPVAVLEACVSGLPVISTRHAGIKDVIIEEETGLLVNEGDAKGMADHMIRLLEDPELAAKLGQKARERAMTEYSMEKSIGRLWEIIKNAINTIP